MANEGRRENPAAAKPTVEKPAVEKPAVEKTDREWREQLTEEQFEVTRRGGTERAFTGRFYRHEDAGLYTCVCCGAGLFRSAAKFESGSGWPSFWRPAADDAIRFLTDASHGMARTEIRCARCDAHLGHVFEDGPRPTGQRYCVNSLSLGFEGGED